MSIGNRPSNQAPRDNPQGGCEIPPRVYEIAFGWDPIPECNRFLLLADVPGRATLELGCGAGRLLIAMAERAQRVVGVELSPEMAELARARVAEHGVDDRCQVLEGDMGCIEFNAEFDLVYCSANTIRHVVDDAAVARLWRGVARALRPGGAAVVDLELGIEYERGRAGAPSRWSLSAGDEEVRASWEVISPPTRETPRSGIRWMFEHRSPVGTRQVYSQELVLRAFDADEFRVVVERAGLCHEGFYEPRDPYLLPLDAKHAAGRCLAVMRKPRDK